MIIRQLKKQLHILFLPRLRAFHYRWTRYRYGPDSLNVGDFYEINGQQMIVTKKEGSNCFYISGYLRRLRPVRWFDRWRAAARNFFYWNTYGLLHRRDIPKRLSRTGHLTTNDPKEEGVVYDVH